ncbi:MAG: uroporphyrinogen-III synthase [Methylophilaceae bacterium]
MNPALANLGIVITRPWQQAEGLASLIKRAGGHPILFPLLEIVALEDYSVFDQTVAKLDGYDWAIFISSNAVQQGMTRLLATRDLPKNGRFAAIGPSTAAELAKYGVTDVLTPHNRFDSESLLALPQMQDVAGRRIMIFRGVGGREVLANTLKDRGAEVTLAECYRRINPSQDASPLKDLWQSGRLHAIVITSSEGLRSLIALNAGAWLYTVPVFVNHPRIAEAAIAEFLQAVLTNSSNDEELLVAIEQWVKAR